MIRLNKPNDGSNHTYFEEQLSAYLDGELLPKEQAALEHHLDTCQACQWNLDTLQQTIKWTRELEPLTVPRVFTIAVPAAPERATRRRWNLAPLLQGATALVALLLFFAVAGDFWLGGFRGAAIPASRSVQEEAPVRVEATNRVMAEAPAEEQPWETADEELTVVETVVVEAAVEAEVAMEVQAEPVTAPLAATAPVTDAAAAVGESSPSETSEEGLSATQALPNEESEQAGEAQATAEPQVGEAPAKEAPQDATGAGTPTMEAQGTPLAQLVEPPAEPRPSQFSDSESLPPDDEESLLAPDQRRLALDWLRLAEYSLGGLFIVLLVAWLVLRSRRRRVR